MSTSALSPSAGLIDSGHSWHARGESGKRATGESQYLDHAFSLRQQEIVQEVIASGRSRHYLALGLIVIAAHIGGAYYYNHIPHVVVAPKTKPVTIEIIKPVIEPPPEVKPPPPPPPPKKVVKEPPPQPKPQPALKTPEAEPDIKPDDIVVQENTTTEKTSEPVEAAPPAPAPEAVKEEPVTEATGYAGYLNNPAPRYPSFAQRQGWQGTVILRVRVLANGRVQGVEIKQSSGRKTLDEAAVEAVKGWEFAPSRRGNTPIDGWATVPIEFKLAS
ncbi:outer membrane transport energization protein TonB [Methylobacillus rhizosphaerae]|uniref:Protein TonB n=1 Tax=Methylobacillus rhizosphaerae TaxID=551994 RepID=A0A238ZQD0_9PROT|nr:energy transducer TonB [Methylobacillus rhizosphaerae]SNR85575.1 outer membrane transport energization protein TonB [Methylobacillus rhizosphaerae]